MVKKNLECPNCHGRTGKGAAIEAYGKYWLKINYKDEGHGKFEKF